MSHAHRKTPRTRQLRLERCEDRALLAGDMMLGGAAEFAPLTELSLGHDTGYVAQDRLSIVTGTSNFYQFDSTGVFAKLTTTFDHLRSHPNLRYSDSIDWSSLPPLVENGTTYNNGYNGAADSGSDLEFGPGADDDGAAGVLISPQIPVIPTAEEVAIQSDSAAVPPETISLASVLRDETPLTQDQVARIASNQETSGVAVDKPAFLKTERQAALSPEAIETLDRAFALEGLEMEATSALKSQGNSLKVSQPDQAARGSIRRDGVEAPEERPAVTQTSFKIPVLDVPAVDSVGDQQLAAQETGEAPVASAPATWPAYLFSKARQTGLALTLGTVAIAIRLRWQRAEESVPQRSPVRKFPHA